MQLLRRIMVTVPLLASLGWAAFGTGVRPVSADDKELALRGLVDCGKKVETRCNIKDTFYFWTEGYGEGTQRVLIDITWIKPESMPTEIDQEDELCLTGFVREADQVYQATAVNEQCDEGTVNDREQQREKKNESKERNKDN